MSPAIISCNIFSKSKFICQENSGLTKRGIFFREKIYFETITGFILSSMYYLEYQDVFYKCKNL